jgi:LPS sulfotransferase NodH
VNIFNHFKKSEDYIRYVNICSARTGSNLLLSYLSDHPNIDAHTEIFRLLNGRTIEDVYDEYFGRKPRRIHAAGCKVFYDHPFDGNPGDLMTWFLHHPRPHYFIHLMRRDRLRSFVSHKISRNLDLWFIKTFASRPELSQRRVTIDIDEAKAYIRDLIRKEDRAKEMLQGHPYMQIYYEDFIADQQNTLALVQDFLKLKVHRLWATHVPMNPEPLSMLVTNYEELLGSGIVEGEG